MLVLFCKLRDLFRLLWLGGRRRGFRWFGGVCGGVFFLRHISDCSGFGLGRVNFQQMRLISGLLAAAIFLNGQEVSIRVHADEKIGVFHPIYGYFGYDEPNFTYTKNGQKLVGELAALSGTPVYIRTHFMLASGDGTAGFKLGSTNAYTEDATGKPVYDWMITDRIIDTYLKAGAKPFIEIGFMPQALSTNPEPYRPDWFAGLEFQSILSGLGVSAEGLCEVGGAGLSVGSTRCREVWERRGGVLVLGSLERTGHRILARHAGGVRQALRRYGRCGEAGVAWGERGRAGVDRSCKREGGDLFAAVPGALRGKECATGFYYLSCQGPAGGRGWACADGNFKECGRCGRKGFRDRQRVSQVSKSADCVERVRSGGVRGVLGAGLSAECISEWAALCRYTKR